jgi:hypothetical protein
MAPVALPKRVLTAESFIPIVAVDDNPSSTLTLAKDIAPVDCKAIFLFLFTNGRCNYASIYIKKTKENH